jgi:hypothetical protein
MPRVALITTPAAGHLNPLSQTLVRLGERGLDRACVLVDTRGATLTAAQQRLLDGVEIRALESEAVSSKDFTNALQIENGFARWASRLFRDADDEITLIRDLLRELRPSFVIIDMYIRTFPALAAVRDEGIPHALVWCNLMGVAPLRMRTYRREVDHLTREWSLRHGITWSDDASAARGPLNIVPTTARLLAADAAIADVELAGLPGAAGVRGDEVAFDFGRLESDKPLVYVSFGTFIHWQPELFRLVFAAAARVGARVLASVGRDIDLGDVGDHVVLAEYVPQREVLRKAAVFVTHGGYNSVAEALRAGTPMLVIPLDLDQPVQAQIVTEAGVGVAVDKANASESSVEAALERLLDERNGFRERAQAFARAVENDDAATRTAELVAGAIRA